MTQSHLDPETQLSELLSRYDEELAQASDASTISSQPFVTHLADAELQQRFNRIQACLELLDQDRRRQAASVATVAVTFEVTDGRTATSDETATVPRRIGRFRVIRRLGSGGFGVVLLAEDPVLRRQVAIKMPLASIFQSQELHARFLRECRAAAKLNHPGIVRVLECGDVQGIPFQVAEYVNGERLSDLLRRERPTARTSAILVKNLADALQHAHEHGVLHRDIKPDNILLQQSSARALEQFSAGADEVPAKIQLTNPEELIPRITDFGLARLADEDTTLSRSGTLVGTPKYMSPEQLKGQTAAHGPQSDIYSLGVVFYELLTGQIPFPEATNLHSRIAIADQEVVPLCAVSSEIPAGLLAICMKCLHVDRSRRYSTASELSNDLQNYIDKTECSGTRQEFRIQKAGSRSPKWWAVAGIALTVLASVIAWAPWSDEGRNANGIHPAGNESPQTPAPRSSEQQPFSVEGREFLAGGPVLTTPFQYDGQTPLTIEAWVQPQRPFGCFLFVSGIGLQIQEQEGKLSLVAVICPTENSCVVMYTPTIIREGEWNHLAVVYDAGEFQVFVHGKKCSTVRIIEDDDGKHDLSEEDRISLPGTTEMFQLTVGSNSVASTPRHRYPFTGRIRSLRVSEGNIYTSDFEPPDVLAVQPTTTALYKFDNSTHSFPDEANLHGPLMEHEP